MLGRDQIAINLNRVIGADAQITRRQTIRQESRLG
jgi:hypothetical protein